MCCRPGDRDVAVIQREPQLIGVLHCVEQRRGVRIRGYVEAAAQERQ